MKTEIALQTPLTVIDEILADIKSEKLKALLIEYPENFFSPEIIALDFYSAAGLTQHFNKLKEDPKSSEQWNTVATLTAGKPFLFILVPKASLGSFSIVKKQILNMKLKGLGIFIPSIPAQDVLGTWFEENRIWNYPLR